MVQVRYSPAIPQKSPSRCGTSRSETEVVSFRIYRDESDVCLDCSSYPEFDDWKWVDYRTAADQVIDFKQQVYRDALAELEPYFDQVSENN